MTDLPPEIQQAPEPAPCRRPSTLPEDGLDLDALHRAASSATDSTLARADRRQQGAGGAAPQPEADDARREAEAAFEVTGAYPRSMMRMPPRYAYWTILIDNRPTAFRAQRQRGPAADLQPASKRKQPERRDEVVRARQAVGHPRAGAVGGQEPAETRRAPRPRLATRRNAQGSPGRDGPAEHTRIPDPHGPAEPTRIPELHGPAERTRIPDPNGPAERTRIPDSERPGGTHKDLQPARPDRPKGRPKRPAAASKGPRRNRG